MTALDADRRTARETTHHGPDHLVLSEHPLFRRFWYAACFADAVTDGRSSARCSARSWWCGARSRAVR